MKTVIFRFCLIALLSLSSAVHSQTLQRVWGYTYTETDPSRPLSFLSPLNMGSDGSVAFVATRNSPAGVSSENRIFWVRALPDGSSPTDPLWDSQWLPTGALVDVIAIRKNHLVITQEREIRSVVIDSSNNATVSTVQTFPSVDGNAVLEFSREQTRSPGLIFSVAVRDDRLGFTVDAYQFTPAPPAISEVATLTSVTGNTLSISFRTDIGVDYQLQSSTTLDALTWQNVGSAVSGNGMIQTLTQPATLPSLFFRVVAL